MGTWCLPVLLEEWSSSSVSNIYCLTPLTPRSNRGIDAIMVVPTVASFAIQTMTQIVCLRISIAPFSIFITSQLQTFSDRRLAKRKETQTGDSPESKDESYMSHAELVVQQHASLHQRNSSLLGSQPRSMYLGNNITGTQSRDRDKGSMVGIDHQESGLDAIHGTTSAENGEQTNLDKLLIKRILQLSVELEMHARVILMHALPKGSRPEVLLRADMVRRLLVLATC